VLHNALNSITEIGIYEDANYSDHSRIRVINSTCIIGLFITICSNLYLHIEGEFFLFNFLIFCLAFTMPLFANYYKLYTIARLAIYTGGIIAIAIAMRDTPDKIIYFAIAIIVIPYFFHEREFRILFLLITLLLPFLNIWYFDLNIYHTHNLRPVFFIITLLTCVMMVRKFIEIRSEKLNQNKAFLEELNEQKKSLATKEQSLSDVNDKLAIQNIELENFVYIASHDLKQPIRNTISYVQLLRRKLGKELGQDQLLGLGNLEQNAVHINSLITDLLTYSRVGKNCTPSEIDFKQLLVEIETEISNELDNRVTIEYNSNLFFNGRRDDVKYLFKEYINNVIENNSDNSNLKVLIKSVNDGHEIKVSVEDNGIGIPENKIAEIQNMFTKADKNINSSGSGLGLAICKKIVELHGGYQSFSKSSLGGLCVSVKFKDLNLMARA